MSGITRRRFVQGAAATVGASLWASRSGAMPEPLRALPTVRLGRTNRTLPRLGLGTAPLGRLGSDEEAVAVLCRAIELGVRYLDTAPSYSGGRAERRIAEALRESEVARGEFFIATKTLRRDAEGARRELEESLKRLGTDHVDSVQVHEVHDDVETVFSAGSVLGALEKAREEGLVRHIGITGHRNPAYVIDAIGRYEFATALVPVNPLDTKHLSFTRGFLPVAAERGVAVIAMKIFGGGALLADGQFTAGELLRYALSQPEVAIAVPGCDKVAHVDEAYSAVAAFKPLTAGQRAALEQRAGEHRGKASEWYKEAGP